MGDGRTIVGNRGGRNGIGPQGTKTVPQVRGGAIVPMAIRSELLSVGVAVGVGESVAVGVSVALTEAGNNNITKIRIMARLRIFTTLHCTEQLFCAPQHERDRADTNKNRHEVRSRAETQPFLNQSQTPTNLIQRIVG